MAVVMIILALGLGFAAYKAETAVIKWFLITCCLLNALTAASVIYDKDPYAFKLRPNDGTLEPALRR
jgi:hypothetical protein